MESIGMVLAHQAFVFALEGRGIEIVRLVREAQYLKIVGLG